MGDFDPSPRATKRRKTTKYGTQRTTLPDQGTDNKTSTEEADSDIYGQYMSAEEQQMNTPSKTQRTPRNLSTRNGKTRSTTQPTPGQAVKDAHDGSVTPSRSGRRPKASSIGSRAKQLQEEIVDASDPDNERDGVREETGHMNGMEHEEYDEQTQSSEQVEGVQRTRNSSRQRKKPSRYTETEAEKQPKSTRRSKATAVEDTAIQYLPESPALKGILTPSRKQRIGPRKSVMFNQDDKAIGERLGFKDIDTPAKDTPRKSRKKLDEPLAEQSVPGDIPEPIAILEEDYLDPVLVDEGSIIEPPLLDLPTEIPNQSHSIKLSTDPYLISIKETILARLTSVSPPSTKPPPHLAAQYQTLHTLLNATVTASESNSLLLLGPHGSGKSALLGTSLANLAIEHGPSFFHTIHLSGFLQTDDRLALREIWRQLGREMNVDETETEDVAGSYADTMASLLSLLSHPDELAIDNLEDGTIDPQMLESTDLGAVNGEQKTSKSIVFILDEFDLFTTHPRQTLLYNLFDIAQSRKAPIAVIGCSTRMDVIECLEKRVKSRFSHRWLLIPGCKNLVEWEASVKDVLTFSVEGQDVLKRSKEEEQWAEKWNKYITDTFLTSSETQHLLKTHFYTTKSLPDLFMSLYPHIATLDPSLPPSTTTPHHTTTAQPSILSILSTLPILHLSLLISTTRLTTIHALPATNFNLIHAHYTELIARSKLQQTAHGAVAVGSGSLREWGRDVCRAAWEELGGWGVIVPVVGGGMDGDGVGDEETRMWRVEVGLGEVEWGVRERFGGGVGAGEVLVKWCREV